MEIDLPREDNPLIFAAHLNKIYGKNRIA